MKSSISKSDVSNFKNKWCNENGIIAGLIREELLDYFKEPILDVGAGMGDIAYNALYNKKVNLIDVNEVTEMDFPLSPNHGRQTVDFFNYFPIEKINTIFICHTLQFIDEDIGRLNGKIERLNTENLICVTNNNDDIMGELINWSLENYKEPNPEVHHVGFPSKDFIKVKELPFQATLSCNTYKELAKQISYLMLFELDQNKEKRLVEYLVSLLKTPSFDFGQKIHVYRRTHEEKK